jgi:hypothetical protein
MPSMADDIKRAAKNIPLTNEPNNGNRLYWNVQVDANILYAIVWLFLSMIELDCNADEQSAPGETACLDLVKLCWV